MSLIRGSRMFPTTRAPSSVEPSSTTTTSKSWNDWRRTDSIARPIWSVLLYNGTTTEMPRPSRGGIEALRRPRSPRLKERRGQPLDEFPLFAADDEEIRGRDEDRRLHRDAG